MYDSRNSFINSSGNNKQIIDKQIDHETEQEAIQVIRSQAKKLKLLSNELESREEEITYLKQKLNGIDNYKSQLDNFKRQVYILDEKLRVYESENNRKNHDDDQYRQLVDSEFKLRAQMINKDKVLKEYDLIIKDQDKAISQLKNQIMDKEGLNKELKQEFNEITGRFKNLTVKMSYKEDEYQKYCSELEVKINNLEEEKKITGEKINELIDIVKQQSKELGEFQIRSQSSEKENKNLLRNLEILEKDNENRCKINEELKSQFNVVNKFRQQINEAESELNKLHNELQFEREKFSNLKEENQNLTSEIEQLKNKFSGENSPHYLRQVIESKNEDINNLNHYIDHNKKSNAITENKIRDLENENKEIILAINVEINTINHWIETYLGVYYDPLIEIPELPFTISKVLKNNVRFDSLKENLINSQKKMNNELNKGENFIYELKRECDQNIQKQEALIKDISNAKNQLLAKNEEIFLIQNENEQINREILHYKENKNNIKLEYDSRTDTLNNFLEKINNVLTSQFDKIKQNNIIINYFPEIFYKKNYPEGLRDQIWDSIQNLTETLDIFINKYDPMLRKLDDHKVLKQESEKFRKENRIQKNEVDSYNEEKYNNILDERNELITNLNNEIILLKNAMQSMQDKIDIDNNEKLRILEKKIVNMSNEVKLKEIQIKNQEEMIIRRNTELQMIKDSNTKSLTPDLNLQTKSEDIFKNMKLYNYNIHDKSKTSTMNNSSD